ncbi:MAG: glycosyltransferase family 4 protein [Acidobacteria bacterium]|nr:glycosyltransferase family 4 protein [Acidobacteriota bacterium]
MRVALLSRGAHPLHPPGGMERAVYHLAKHLRAKGVETVLVTRPATREGATFPGDLVTVPYATWRGLAHGRVLDRALHYPRFSRRLGAAVAELVAGGRVDLVHAQGLTAWGYGRLRRRDRSLRAPLVMNPQGMEEHKTRGLKRLALTRLRALSREAARLADRVVATDFATQEEVERLLGVEAARVVVLPNGIDPDEIAGATPADPAAAVRAAFPAVAESSPMVLSVGRLEAYKGFGDVLAALAQLHGARRLPEAWAWVVVGQGSDRARLLAAAVERGVASHVHLVGRVADRLLHALYARADIFAHATRYEGSSLVTLEAMAHGLPVVASRTGGIPDKVVPGETGLLVEPGDVAGLAEGLLALAADPSRRKALGVRGRALALGAFGWPVLAERTIALYERLLAEVPR